jgi:DNA primase
MSTVEEIKQRLDILDIVGGYLRLEKAGSNFKALCPFHQEKTSSFFVFPDKQSWRCFGCGAGGDLIAFVMKKEDIDFTEALKLLADRAGVSLKRRKEPAEDRVTEKLYQINETAAKYYYDLLLQERVAKIARDYVENRGLSQKSVSDFQLGFSSGDGLKRYLMEEGYRESEIISSGLLLRISKEKSWVSVPVLWMIPCLNT